MWNSCWVNKWGMGSRIHPLQVSAFSSKFERYVFYAWKFSIRNETIDLTQLVRVCVSLVLLNSGPNGNCDYWVWIFSTSETIRCSSPSGSKMSDRWAGQSVNSNNRCCRTEKCVITQRTQSRGAKQHDTLHCFITHFFWMVAFAPNIWQSWLPISSDVIQLTLRLNATVRVHCSQQTYFRFQFP